MPCKFFIPFSVHCHVTENYYCSLFLNLRELDATVMRAIASLLSGLPLQPEGTETDIVEAKSQLFLKYVVEIS
mgnify:CR=1 FL=1